MTGSNDRSVAVIGGGFTGLTAAYDLARSGVNVTLFERAEQLGGLVVGCELAGYPVEKAYHFIYKTDADIIGLVEELGLDGSLTFHDSSLSTLWDGRLWPLMTPLDLLRFKPLSPIDRIRAGATVLYLQRVKKWRKLAEVTADEWLRRWAGPRVTEVLWTPLLEGKFDRYHDKVNMSWLWGRVKVRVDSKEKGDTTEKLGYFDGGFAVVVDALAKGILDAGGRIVTGAAVDEIDHIPERSGSPGPAWPERPERSGSPGPAWPERPERSGSPGPAWPERPERSGSSVQVRVDGEDLRFDAVVCTIPTNVFTRLTSTSDYLDNAERERLERIEYLGAVVYVFATSKPITDYYWHNISERNAPFVVFLTLTNLVGSEAFGGLHIHYIGDYVPHEHRYFTMSEEELIESWHTELAARFPDFDPGDVVDGELVRLANAQHVVDVGYEDRIPPHKTAIPGVYLANFSQIHPQDRGTNYAVAEGRAIATMAVDDLARNPASNQDNNPNPDPTALTTEDGGPS